MPQSRKSNQAQQSLLVCHLSMNGISESETLRLSDQVRFEENAQQLPDQFGLTLTEIRFPRYFRRNFTNETEKKRYLESTGKLPQTMIAHFISSSSNSEKSRFMHRSDGKSMCH